MTERKTQRLGGNSTASRSAAFASASARIEPPPGVELRTDDEQTIWDQFTRARAKADWRDMDLILLAKVVRIEADIRKYQVSLDRSGPLIKNKRETLIENPLLRVIDTLQRQQLAIIRSMSLNQTASDPRVMDAQARTENEARETMQKYGIESLIASPMRQQ
jgi:hypothetical protein